ncbi:hypothetical protein NVSP9465_01532 [Novosphingobium sp. CECT 9465]|nr:hypothetical protein NVSP9465_01532 [Novosphingobium sp. CECT 9465]
MWRMLLALLLASAVPAPNVIVNPADPTAPFQGDGKALKFDPACRDYTVESVHANPDCAARVENGEAGPSLAIAALTLETLPAKAAEAVKILRRSAGVTDSPAVHYFLGSVLGTAERFQPNHKEAVQHLEVAARRGNPAAADLLANLLIAGKGTSRDVPRAVQLFEQAATGGFPSAAVSLGKLYLAGKYVPKDAARGQAWLDAAASVNAPAAVKLSALARNQSKVENFQIIPSVDPAKVKAVSYGTFDNPDIPPNFGFDTDFQAVFDKPYDDPATLDWLERNAATLPTPYLYELARRLAVIDGPRSLRTFLVARTRMAYDASRCLDQASLESLRAWDMLIIPDLRFLFASGRLPPAIAIDALAEEQKLSGELEPWWVCRSGMIAMTKALSGNAGALQLKPTTEWPALRKAAQMRLARLAGNP